MSSSADREFVRLVCDSACKTQVYRQLLFLM